jgi:hypothetical protein
MRVTYADHDSLTFLIQKKRRTKHWFPAEILQMRACTYRTVWQQKYVHRLKHLIKAQECTYHDCEAK